MLYVFSFVSFVVSAVLAFLKINGTIDVCWLVVTSPVVITMALFFIFDTFLLFLFALYTYGYEVELFKLFFIFAMGIITFYISAFILS